MIRMSNAIYHAIRRHGEETYPHECCGILLGRNAEDDNVVIDAMRAGNTRTDSAHNRYHIAPQELIKAQREGRERGLDIVGFYHSHPDHPAMWSQTDLAEAHWMGCSYVITAVEKGSAQQTNSFLLRGTSEEDKRLEVEPVVLEGVAEPAAARC
jgi:proteasome lid subunit RPN8/RPN11